MEHIVIIEVPFLKIPFFGYLRRKQGFSFDMQCWNYLSDYTQLAFNEFDVLDGEKFITKAIYAGAVSYNLWHGRKVKFNEKNVKNWIDNSYRSEIARLITAMTKSRIGGKTIEEYFEFEETEKKK